MADLFKGPLGDNISNIEIVNHMGDDLMVVNTARVSMAKESGWMVDEFGYDVLNERDTKLVHYLAKHGHWTPFSHPQISLRIKMPIFVARQWFKHMVGFTRNEVSRRYVDDTPEFYIPTEWRLRAENVKQGSSDEVVEIHQQNMAAYYGHITKLYKDLLTNNVAPEMARMILPQSMYTEFIETGSLAAYARLCKLRLDQHAQKEVRLYAEGVADIMASLFPVSWAALQGETK